MRPKRIMKIGTLVLVLALAVSRCSHSATISLKELREENTRTATFTVAASNSSEMSKRAADYLCDGTNDEVELLAAMAALPTEAIENEQFTAGPFAQWDALDAVGAWVAIQGDEALAADGADKKEGTASLKITGGPTDNPGAKITGLASLDWSSYNIAVLWVKMALVPLRLTLYDSAGEYQEFETATLWADNWSKIEFDLGRPTNAQLTLDWTDITEVRIQALTTTDSFVFRLDDFCLNKWVELANDAFLDGTVSVGSYTEGKEEDYVIDYAQGKIQACTHGGMTSGSNYNANYTYSLGGKVQLSEGDFYFKDQLASFKGRTSLLGLGENITRIHLDATFPTTKWVVNARFRSDIEIGGFSLDMNSVNALGGITMAHPSVYVAHRIEGLKLHDIEFDNVKRFAYQIHNGYPVSDKRSRAYNSELRNLKVNGVTANTADLSAAGLADSIIADCSWSGGNDHYVFAFYECDNTLLLNPHFSNVSGNAYALAFSSCRKCTVENPTFRDFKAGWWMPCIIVVQEADNADGRVPYDNKIINPQLEVQATATRAAIDVQADHTKIWGGTIGLPFDAGGANSRWDTSILVQSNHNDFRDITFHNTWRGFHEPGAVDYNHYLNNRCGFNCYRMFGYTLGLNNVYDKMILSGVLDLCGAPTDIEVYYTTTNSEMLGYVIFYNEATSGDAGVIIRVGVYDAGSDDNDFYDVVTSAIDQGKGTYHHLLSADLTNDGITSHQVLTVGTAGGKAGTGKVRILLQIAEIGGT